MKPYISVLQLRSPPGMRGQAIEQFMQRGVLTICRDAVPGFLSGRLLQSQDDPNLACVICEWTDREAFEQWMSSPLRSPNTPDRLFEPSGRSALFELVEELHR